MKFKEFSLWFLLLVFLFLAGYLKGYLPDSQLSSFLGDREKIRILTVDKKLLPSAYLQTIADSARIEIQLEECKDWQDCSVKYIANPGYNLIFIEHKIIQKLVREGLVLNLNPIKKEIETNIHPDFYEIIQNTHYLIPLYWQFKDGYSVYGFAIPKSVPNRFLSLKILKNFINAKYNLMLVQQLGMASTFSSNENDNLPRTQKASYLREINLKKIFTN